MKLEEIREAYYFRSGKASDICRQLGFAGIALIWVFKEDANEVLDTGLVWPGLLIVISLSFDFLHYYVGAMIWGSFHRSHEVDGKTEGDDISVPASINYFNNLMWFFKCLLMMVAYCFLFIYIVGELFQTPKA